jgi:glycosyltransferase involved in cell wall biosynthesis
LRCDEALVSVVIPTFNSEMFLERCLSSLKSQSYSPLEIIVVDEDSDDRTVEIARRFGCRILKNAKPGRAGAKNMGARNSRGEYVFFVDSDQEVTANVVGECVDLARSRPRVGGIMVPERSVGDGFWVRVRDFERSFSVGAPFESARFFPAHLVKKAGGFEEDLIFFEESTLPYKIHKAGFGGFLRASSPILHHEDDFVLSVWLRKKFCYGKTFHTYKDKYGDYFAKLAGFAPRLRLFTRDWRRFCSKPVLAVGVVLLKSQEFLVTMLGAFCS